MPVNKYSSRWETFRAPNVMASAISPPNDYIPLVFANGTPRVMNVFDTANTGSNLIIHRAGLFCNFADGLVLKNGFVGPHINLKGVGYVNAPTAPTGTISCSINSLTITGVGTNFTSVFSGGSAPYIIGIPSLSTIVPTVEYYTITSIASDTSLDISAYPLYAKSGVSFSGFHPDITTVDYFVLPNVRELNYMYDFSRFIDPSSVVGAANLTNPPLVALLGEVSVASGTGGVANDPTYLTHSINTDFDGELGIFDILAEVEYTAA